MVLLLDDPRIRAIGVHECGEPLLPVPERLSAPDRQRSSVREAEHRRLVSRFVAPLEVSVEVSETAGAR